MICTDMLYTSVADGRIMLFTYYTFGALTP
ncbi:hypothetical protein Cassandra_0305 [Pseudomonas phage Cassandra]|nr:hypothetical protein Cassandra_0305 [Pseudomonas phage Cassandra]WPK39501.1 hypothetical protein Deiofobo_0304 [Pseudomonas phage Deifobo]